MSLDKKDLENIRTLISEEVRPLIREEIRPIIREEIRPIVREEVSAQLVPVYDRLDSIDGRLTATENDVKDIYYMISDVQADVKSLKTDTSHIANHLSLTLPSASQ